VLPPLLLPLLALPLLPLPLLLVLLVLLPLLPLLPLLSLQPLLLLLLLLLPLLPLLLLLLPFPPLPPPPLVVGPTVAVLSSSLTSRRDILTARPVWQWMDGWVGSEDHRYRWMWSMGAVIVSSGQARGTKAQAGGGIIPAPSQVYAAVDTCRQHVGCRAARRWRMHTCSLPR
jgi:hypothetical protein